MANLRSFGRPLLILAIAFVADVAGRLAFDFEMRRVLVLEAVLFGATCLLLIWSATRDKARSRIVGNLELCLAVIFALGGLRAALWACGLPVTVANMLILLAGLAVVGVYALWRRAARRSNL